MENTKKNTKRRSRAITEIISEIGYTKWYELSVSQKDAKIKIKIAEFKKRAKKGRQFMKELNREYCGYYSTCHASGLKEIQMYLFFYYKKSFDNI